jgi:hypothetical protein
MLHEGLWQLYTELIKLNPGGVNPRKYSSAQVSLQDVAIVNELLACVAGAMREMACAHRFFLPD